MSGMNKRQLIEKLWLSVAERLPPDELHTTVITFNAFNGYISAWPASLAREYAQDKMADKHNAEKWSWDRQYTHWFLPYPPEGKKNCAEFCEEQKTGNKANKNKGDLSWMMK